VCGERVSERERVREGEEGREIEWVLGFWGGINFIFFIVFPPSVCGEAVLLPLLWFWWGFWGYFGFYLHGIALNAEG